MKISLEGNKIIFKRENILKTYFWKKNIKNNENLPILMSKYNMLKLFCNFTSAEHNI